MKIEGTSGKQHVAAQGVGTGAPLAQFLVPAATSLQERRLRSLKDGDSFMVCDPNGDAVAAPDSTEGLYYRDCRHLSKLFLSIEGRRPLLLSSGLRDDNATLVCDLTNPDLFDADGRLIHDHDLIHMRRARFLWNAVGHERLVLKNFDQKRRRFRLDLAFAADFADLFEVRGTARTLRGRHHPPEVAADAVTLSYTGLDSRRRETRLRFAPAPSRLDGDSASYDIDLAPQESLLIFIEIACDRAPAGPPRRAFARALRDLRQALRIVSGGARIESSNQIFDEAAGRARADLTMLITRTPEGPYPYAGIPWFSTVFGRDGLITALQTLWLDPRIARGVLRYLAAHQAAVHDAAADAEPGKILHEMRRGEMAELGEVPFRRYYGSVDATPLFVMLAGAYLERTGDLDTLRALWPHVEAALTWIAEEGDRDGDGFVEYGRRTRDGLINQGWKDSHDAVFHEDGRLATGPIALAEVQAYVYGAWRAGSTLAARLGHGLRAQELAVKAEFLRMQFDEAFFDRELGLYVLALDGEKRPCRVRASNAGHALLTGIALPERAESVVQALMSRELFSGWGVRTVATTEARYNPLSYHNGSVWPHDNALIAAGCARYGFRDAAARIFGGIFAAATYIELRRLPELFCGFPRQRSIGPTFYPVACAPQAWAATSTFSLLQSCLGLSFSPAASAIVFDRPMLPAFLDRVILRGLHVNSASADVEIARVGGQVTVKVLVRSGKIQVLTTQ